MFIIGFLINITLSRYKMKLLLVSSFGLSLFCIGMNSYAFSSSLLWKKELKYPVDNVVVSSNGTSIAISNNPYSFTALSAKGEIITSNELTGFKSINSISPFMAGGDLYIPTAGNGNTEHFTAVIKYTPQDHYSKLIIPFQSNAFDYINNIKLSRDHKKIYVSTGAKK